MLECRQSGSSTRFLLLIPEMLPQFHGREGSIGAVTEEQRRADVEHVIHKSHIGGPGEVEHGEELAEVNREPKV